MSSTYDQTKAIRTYLYGKVERPIYLLPLSILVFCIMHLYCFLFFSIALCTMTYYFGTGGRGGEKSDGIGG